MALNVNNSQSITFLDSELSVYISTDAAILLTAFKNTPSIAHRFVAVMTDVNLNRIN